jgi:hypothetical protein
VDNLETSSALVRLAHRLRNDPRYMSYVLATYQRQEGLTDEELAQELGTLQELSIRLALCKRPMSSSSRFADEVREIADHTLTDEVQLASILRQVDGLEKLTSRPGSAAQETSQPNYSLSGLLAAARDRDDEIDNQKASDEEAETDE